MKIFQRWFVSRREFDDVDRALVASGVTVESLRAENRELRSAISEAKAGVLEAKTSVDRAWQRADREQQRADRAEARCDELLRELMAFARESRPDPDVIPLTTPASDRPTLGPLALAALRAAEVGLPRRNRIALHARVNAMLAEGQHTDAQIAKAIARGETREITPEMAVSG